MDEKVEHGIRSQCFPTKVHTQQHELPKLPKLPKSQNEILNQFKLMIYKYYKSKMIHFVMIIVSIKIGIWV